MATVVANGGPNGTFPASAPCNRPTGPAAPGNETPGPAFTSPCPASWRGPKFTANALGFAESRTCRLILSCTWGLCHGGRAEASWSSGAERRRSSKAWSEGQEFQQGRGGAALPLSSFRVPGQNCGKPATGWCFLGANL